MPENRVREFREKAGLSQTALAQKIKVAPQNLSSIERCKLAPWKKIKRKLARALCTSESELFPGEAATEVCQDGK
jgi:ribosome-binding protein aMBF1 (putative translation factor)